MRHPTRVAVLLLGVLTVFLSVSQAQKQQSTTKLSDINIPYTKFVLDNGLTLLVHEDHKVPIVAVNVWYHVGSKNEKFGRTGFAHLFEHLMFNGSEDFNDDYFQALERVGATDLNGTTTEDRTNYFQNVPTSAVDLALWMESDRMGHLVGAITQGKLDEQRGVVQNEKRQGDNEPYAVTEDLIIKSTYPAGHPYSHSVIGSMEDLNAAALGDVKEWFKTYYGAANAVLVVAGDIDTKIAFDKVKKYFGDIPSGPPVAKQDAWTAKRSGVQREEVQDRVPQARVYMVWNVPAWSSADADYLNLLTRLLTSGKSSRLYKRLVYDDQIATDVSAYLDAREIGSQFDIVATAKPGGDIRKVEKAIDEEMAKFFKSGPTTEELQRVKTEYIARFIRGSERIGGFGGKSDILAQNLVFAGDPDHYKISLSRVENASTEDVLKTAKEWLSDGVYILDVFPFPSYTTAPTDTTIRKNIPAVGEAPVAKFPTLHRATLSNGLKIILAERSAIPVISFSLQFDAGYASDASATPGTANLAMGMLDEGTTTRSALTISDELSKLGATLNTGSGLDESFVSLSALKANLDASLDIFADVVLNPSFPQADFERLQKQTIARIQREKVQPIQMALRILPALIYGPHHAYGSPFTGSGTEAAVSKMTRGDMVKFHQTWLKPNNATLVIVGATTMDEIKPKLEKLFKNWKSGDVPSKNVPTVDFPAKPVVYILDKPGSQQSVILASEVAPPTNNPNEAKIEAMNTILGSAFTSRINMNLREDKHWSYGAGSFLPGARGQRPFIAYGPVQTDKTKESMVEMDKELRDILGKRPATDTELKKVQNSMTLELPGSWETMGAVSGSISNLVTYGLPDNYYETYPAKIRAL
ncbi:MAG TPA: pitrilysin family protein, partial [Bacteroidota bacterium]|nr:pitrilysin family protein [Bacteroidota bacterium]